MEDDNTIRGDDPVTLVKEKHETLFPKRYVVAEPHELSRLRALVEPVKRDGMKLVFQKGSCLHGSFHCSVLSSVSTQTKRFTLSLVIHGHVFLSLKIQIDYRRRLASNCNVSNFRPSSRKQNTTKQHFFRRPVKAVVLKLV